MALTRPTLGACGMHYALLVHSHQNFILQPPLISQLDELLQGILERNQCTVLLSRGIVSIPDIDCLGLLLFGTDN
jgi:hypothetical protein